MTGPLIQPEPPIDSLFARARASDPAPSHRAARRMNRSGVTDERCRWIASALRDVGPSTYRELGRVMRAMGYALDDTEVMRRLDTCRKRGTVVMGADRADKVTGNAMSEWRAAPCA